MIFFVWDSLVESLFLQHAPKSKTLNPKKINTRRLLPSFQIWLQIPDTSRQVWQWKWGNRKSGLGLCQRVGKFSPIGRKWYSFPWVIFGQSIVYCTCLTKNRGWITRLSTVQQEVSLFLVWFQRKWYHNSSEETKRSCPPQWTTAGSCQSLVLHS